VGFQGPAQASRGPAPDGRDMRAVAA
jgi:hypothetical protein